MVNTIGDGMNLVVRTVHAIDGGLDPIEVGVEPMADVTV
jgi:hypothetical protein